MYMYMYMYTCTYNVLYNLVHVHVHCTCSTVAMYMIYKYKYMHMHCTQMVRTLLEDLPAMFADASSTQSALGAALQTAEKLLVKISQSENIQCTCACACRVIGGEPHLPWSMAILLVCFYMCIY